LTRHKVPRQASNRIEPRDVHTSCYFSQPQRATQARWPRGAGAKVSLFAALIEESCSSSADFSLASFLGASIDGARETQSCRCSSVAQRPRQSPSTATCRATASACTACAAPVARDSRRALRCARSALEAAPLQASEPSPYEREWAGLARGSGRVHLAVGRLAASAGWHDASSPHGSCNARS
jgi:hypothetical protein